MGTGIGHPLTQRLEHLRRMRSDERPDGELGGEALRQRVQTGQRARHLAHAAPSHPLARTPQDPARQTRRIERCTQANGFTLRVDFQGRPQGLLQHAGGLLKIGWQGCLECVGDLQGAGLEFEAVQTLERPTLKALAIEAGPGGLQVLARMANRVAVDQVLEGFSHRRLTARVAARAPESRTPHGCARCCGFLGAP
jgi:hypothetical protein